MDLACGSPVVFMADRSTPEEDGFTLASPAHSFYSHLLRPGEHYVHIEADHLAPQRQLDRTLAQRLLTCSMP